jgi:translation initiation factor IF-1
MSELVKCRTCGELVSSNATACPHCGEPYPTRSIVCPHCGSDDLAVHGRKGFSTGKALVGAILVGPLGVAAGGLGHQNIRLTCSKCGYGWEDTQSNLNAQVTGKTVLEKGVTLDGTVFSTRSGGVLEVDLGDGNVGTLYITGAISRKRKKMGRAAIQPGDSVTVQISDTPLPGNIGVQMGYLLKLIDPFQILERESQS